MGAFWVPTNMHMLVVGHDTAEEETGPPEGVGSFWMLHLLPFQRSAANARPPTVAVQADAAAQDTSRAWSFDDGFGVDWIVQRPPAHRSATTRPLRPEES